MAAQGIAAHPDRARAGRRLPGERLEHRGRGHVRHRRHLRVRARPGLRRGRPRLAPAAHGIGRRGRRRRMGRGARLPPGALQRQRDPRHPDAELRGDPAARLAGARAVARPLRLQLSADRDLRTVRPVRSSGRRLPRQHLDLHHPRGGGRRLGVHPVELRRLPHDGGRGRPRPRRASRAFANRGRSGSGSSSAAAAPASRA